MKQELIDWLPPISAMSIEKSANNSYIIKDREGDVSVEIDLSSAKYFVRTGAAESHYKDLLAFLLERYASYIEGLCFDTSSYQQISTKAYIGQERSPKEKLIEEIIAILFKQNPQLGELDKGEYNEDYRIYPELFKNEAIADLLKKLILESQDSKVKTEVLIFFLKANDQELNKIVTHLLNEVEGINKNDLIQIIPFIYENQIPNADKIVQETLHRLCNISRSKITHAETDEVAKKEFLGKIFNKYASALAKGKFGSALLLATNYIPIDYLDEMGRSSFLSAVFNGNTALMKVLKAKGANINATFRGESCFIYGCVANQTEAVQLLLDWGYNVNQLTQGGLSVFHLMVSEVFLEKDYSRLVNMLVKNGADINIQAPAANNFTPLHFAAHHGYVKFIELFLKNGADINAKSIYDITPLRRATARNKIDAIETLLKNGADAYAQTTNNVTSLDFAIDSDNAEMVALFFKYKAVTDPFDCYSKAVIRKKNNSAKVIIHNIDVNLTNESLTLLDVAANADNMEAIEMLVKKGFDISKKHCTGLASAAESKKHATVKKLLELGVDPIPSLVICFKNQDEEVFKLIIDNMKDVNLLSAVFEGFTVLHAAIWEKNLPAIKYIVSKQPDLNIKNGIGDSPLKLAQDLKMKEAVKLLIENGADYKELLNKKSNIVQSTGAIAGIVGVALVAIGLIAAETTLVAFVLILGGSLLFSVSFNVAIISKVSKNKLSACFTEVMLERDAKLDLPEVTLNHLPQPPLMQQQSENPTSEVYNPSVAQQIQAYFKGYS